MAVTTETVLTDRWCAECGYNLRLLALDGACPECNRPVRASLLPDWLNISDARSLHGVRRAIGIFVGGVLIRVLCSIQFALASQYWMQIPTNTWRRISIHIWFYGPRIGMVMEVVAICLLVRIASRSPGEKRRISGKVIVLAAIVIAMGDLSAQTVDYWSPEWMESPTTRAVTFLVSGIKALDPFLSVIFLLMVRRFLRPTRRLLRLVMSAAIVASLIFALRVILEWVMSVLAFRGLQIVNGVGWTMEPPYDEPYWELQNWLTWWSQYMRGICSILFSLPILLLLRRFNAVTKALNALCKKAPES